MQKHMKQHQNKMLYYLGQTEQSEYMYFPKTNDITRCYIYQFDERNTQPTIRRLDNIIDITGNRSVSAFRKVLPNTPLTDKEIIDFLTNAHVVDIAQNYLYLFKDNIGEDAKQDLLENTIPHFLRQMYQILTPIDMNPDQQYYYHKESYDPEESNVQSVTITEHFDDTHCIIRFQNGTWQRIETKQLSSTEEEAFLKFKDAFRRRIDTKKSLLNDATEVTEYLVNLNHHAETEIERLIIGLERLCELDITSEIPEKYQFENITM